MRQHETAGDNMRQHETTWDNMRQHETTWDNMRHMRHMNLLAVWKIPALKLSHNFTHSIYTVHFSTEMFAFSLFDLHIFIFLKLNPSNSNWYGFWEIIKSEHHLLVALFKDIPYLILDGVDFGTFSKCKTIENTNLHKCQILSFNSNCFVGLEVRSLVIFQM